MDHAAPRPQRRLAIGGRMGRMWPVGTILGLGLGLGCATPEGTPPPVNLPPQLLRLTVTPAALLPGQTARLEAAVLDPEGAPLQLRWEADQGTVEPIEALEASLTAPLEPIGTALTVTVHVSDDVHTATLSLLVTLLSRDPDADGDGHIDDDCLPADPHSYPGAEEAPDGQDNNCNGQVDENTEFFDDDQDGFSELEGDCNDASASTYPEAQELPDAQDNDCDGARDEDTLASDDDADGYAEQSSSGPGDCDDTRQEVYPGALELPDAQDNDCDGLIDEGTSLADDDHDGQTEAQGDCNDQSSSTYSQAPELPDFKDNDCDGQVDEDTVRSDDDQDGFSEDQGDCNDASASISPAQPEQLNGLDDDCDGRIDEGTLASDDDGDGFSEQEGDCNDRAPTQFPGASEQPNGVDDDCDGALDENTSRSDDDQDGFSELEGDCDDRSRYRRPGLPDWPDALDNNCQDPIDEDTLFSDDDQDGQTELEGDCDDADPSRFSGAIDLPGDDVDQSCTSEAPKLEPIAVLRVEADAACGPLLLDGTLSWDPQDASLTFTWFVLQAPTGSALAGASSLLPELPLAPGTGTTWMLEPDLSGSYQLGLVVETAWMRSAAALVMLERSGCP